MPVTFKIGLGTLILAGAAQSAAVERVHLAPFAAIALEDGGQVIAEPAARHEIRMVRGDLRDLQVTVREHEGLRIRCRTDSCRRAPPQIVVGTPSIHALAVRGGGRIQVAAGFAAQGKVALAVDGGGQLDARNLSAASVAAAVNGGGSIMAGPARNLAASVNGGGLITYVGTPRLASVVRGGGDIRRAGPDRD